ncbi:aryl-alcohol dehydrogenase-like predicted oxidoreductase [Amycolatopsis sulphurea]|uniref:Aryl-alcohol dehydrogenase-like predicted oxidoreductase n=1 Tax=Amycolatopsis sulphurea TaxID=76022 RepID=A0A2A9FEC8_9PSEU|nr:aldo/keto reductase [Amycolatopsis sulphurea]PFG48775.1 aryl-alcohol dehydrogenase-like predicted oxidoreductase [Amycolatopsis sulphurea]
MTELDSPGGTAGLAGRQVARIGFGAMQLERSSASHEDRLAVLRQAAEGGVNHIDTAQFYGAGLANSLIREALSPYPDDLVIVTKVGADNLPDGKLALRQRPAELRTQVEANLATLGVERLEVVNLRRGDTPPGLVAEGEQVVDLDSQLAELIALREEGKIGGIGLSHVSADQLRHARPAGIVCVQNAYSVLDRSGEPVLQLCREHGLAWVPYFPLGSAFQLGRDVTGDPVVTGIAADLGVTPAQVALAWLLAHYEGTLLIPGTANPVHLAENLAVGAVRLPAGAIAALDLAAAAVR